MQDCSTLSPLAMAMKSRKDSEHFIRKNSVDLFHTLKLIAFS